MVEQKNPHLKHLNMVCCLTSHIFSNDEFLFSAGYDGKINIWEIFEKKAPGSSLMSANIVP